MKSNQYTNRAAMSWIVKIKNSKPFRYLIYYVWWIEIANEANDSISVILTTQRIWLVISIQSGTLIRAMTQCEFC